MTRALIILATLTLVSCGGDDDGSTSGSSSFDSGIPSTAGIAQSATPNGLKNSAGSSSVKSFGACSLNSSSSAADMITCFQTEIFNGFETDEERSSLNPDNYLQGIGEVDSRISNLEGRYEIPPVCLAETPKVWELNFTVGAQTISETIYLQCRESHEVPSNTVSQDMAIGRSSIGSGDWYVVLRTQNTTTTGRILLGKISADGNEISTWTFSWKDTNNDGAVDATEDDVILIRTIANQSTNAFVYSKTAAEYQSNDFGSILIVSDGTNLNITDVEVGGASSFSAVAPFENSGCVSADAIGTAGTDCSSLTLPSEYGLSTLPTPADMNATLMGELKTELSRTFESLAVRDINDNPEEWTEE